MRTEAILLAIRAAIAKRHEQQIAEEMTGAERNAEIIARHEDGLTMREIAQEFGVTYQRVGQIVKRWEQISGSPEIAKLVAEHKAKHAGVARNWDLPDSEFTHYARED